MLGASKAGLLGAASAGASEVIIKAWIDSMTSVELDAIDVRNNSHWGITNVSSSADSI
jgi:hypothetical protein